MSEAVMISIQPKWCKLIANGKKTVEVRKTKPKLEMPFKCYIYQTKKRILIDITRKGEMGWCGEIAKETRIISCPDWNAGKVIGEFVCDRITQYNCDRDYQEYFVAGYVGAYMPTREMCLTQQDLVEYGQGGTLYGWHISNLVIYDEPKELSEFCRNGECDKCGWFENGKCYKKSEQSTYNNHRIKRPPQSWCYVEEQDND